MLIKGLLAVTRIVKGSLFLWVVSADHDGVGAGGEDGADVGEQKWDPEPVISCLCSSGTW